MNQMKVLVVEDEIRLASALKRGLESEGFAVDIAPNGNEGHWLASEQSYDAIVLDIMLPGINGWEVCRRLREQGIWTPILMLTAKDGEYDEAEALDTGADDFMSKPFSYVVLVARLRALLRRGTSPRAPVLTAGALSLDPATRQCMLGPVELKITPREFAILEYLMRNQERVVSKSEIRQHVWDFEFAGDSNVVEVHVSSLRRKLDAISARKIIDTIRGSGYKLVADHD